jgi:hypothetical protein
VIWTEDQLREWSQPAGVLLPGEDRRMAVWLQLYAEMLRQLKAGPTPTIVQRISARRLAEVVWEFDRTTSSREATGKRKARSSRTLEREEQFADFDARSRLNNLALEEFDTVRTFARVAEGGVEVNVVPFNQGKRRSKAG